MGYDVLPLPIFINSDSLTSDLKLVSAIFCQIFIFSPSDSPPKTVKNVFYFIQKALFVLETNGSGIINDVMHWLA